MRTRIVNKPVLSLLSLAILAALSTSACAEKVEFDELKVIIEINATDGDVGFHALADADAWYQMRVDDPDGNKIMNIRTFGALRVQGLTENFFESAEPLCEEDEEEPDERVMALADFLELFPAGEYAFRASMENGDRAKGDAELTYNLPAAPDISMTEDMAFAIDEVVISWAPGDDLGEACHDQDLVDDGIIADPSEVEIVGWEVVVEYDEDDSPEPFRVFSAQLPPEQTSVRVPVEFLQPFVNSGFTEFKFEIGAIEESGNQTFSEGGFEVED